MQHSRALTKKSASNLALAFILLPRERRDAMSALYAFCRAVDDVADEDSIPTEKRRAQLAAWREDIRLACENKKPQFVLNQEFQQVLAANNLAEELGLDGSERLTAQTYVQSWLRYGSSARQMLPSPR